MKLFIPRCALKLHEVAPAHTSQRYSMSGLRLEQENGEPPYWRLVATDGRRLAILRGPSEYNTALDCALDGCPETGEGHVVISLESCKAALSGRGKNTTVGISTGEKGEVSIASGANLTKDQAVDGRFPDYLQVLPKSLSPFRATVDADLLVGLLKVASGLPREGKECCRLTLVFQGAEKPLVLLAKGAGGITYDALLMPLS